MQLVLALGLAVSAHAYTAVHTVRSGRSCSRAARGAVQLCDVAVAESVEWKGAAGWSAQFAEPEAVFPIARVKEILPHRYPFLLVDKVIEFEAGKRAVGVKKVRLFASKPLWV